MNRADALRLVIEHARATGSEEVRAAAELLAPKQARSGKPGPSERGVAFADWFRGTLPGDVRLAAGWREKWARCFDDMIRLDGRSPEGIAAVCRWARAHEFWRSNFQSPLKLRERKDGVMYFDRFAAAMGAARRGAAARAPQSRGYEIEQGKGPKAVSALELLQKGGRP
jgi:hypothetical protein